MSDEIVIKVEHVSKNFVLPHERANSVKSLFTSAAKRRDNKITETQHALRDISFEIKKGEFFGIVGRNGSGKSTLLKILAEIYQPTSGKVQVEGKLVPFIELGVGFNPELTGRENVYLNGAMLGFSVKQINDMYRGIVAFAELERFMDQKLKNYSSGMQVRLAFSMATRAEADVLLVDEVLAVGDADFQRKCFEYFRTLKKHKKTVIFVSHDMGAIRDYCDRAALIEDSKLVIIGNAQKVASEYTKLFTPKDGDKQAAQANDTNRHGNNKVVIKSIKAKQTGESGTSKIRITAELFAHIDTKNPRIGFTLKDSFLRPLVGTNTKIENYDLGPIKKGQTYHISFELEDVFRKGDYTVDFSIEDESASEVYDWWEDAVSFWIAKDTNTAFVISPHISIKGDAV